MNRYLDPYIGMLRIGIRSNLYYKADFIMNMLFSIGYALLMIFVWTVLFESSGQGQIGGFTLYGMYAYFFLFTATYAVAEVGIANRIQNDVLDGTISLGLIRPISYIMQLFLASLSRALVAITTFSLPLLLIAVFVAHIPITAYNIAMSIMVLAIGFGVYSIISFLIGTLAIFITYIYGLRYVSSMLIYVVAGGVVPLSMLPQYLSNIVYTLPFQNMGYLPVSILLGNATLPAVANGVIVGIVWMVGLGIFAFFWWKMVSKRITSVGG